ncbi:MAG: hypothetical protein WCH61_06155 [bacterium]
MSAKIQAEYAVGFVNDFIRQEEKDEVPMAIARSFAMSMQRAAKALDAEAEEDDKVQAALKAMAAALVPLLATDQLNGGRLDGSLPVTVLAVALRQARLLFAHVYASSMNKAHMEVLDFGETTNEGVVKSWDREKFDCPEELIGILISWIGSGGGNNVERKTDSSSRFPLECDKRSPALIKERRFPNPPSNLLCLLRIPQAAPVAPIMDYCTGTACEIRKTKQKF